MSGSSGWGESSTAGADADRCAAGARALHDVPAGGVQGWVVLVDGYGSIADYFAGKKVALFSVPGAFTPTCSAKHLPGFVEPFPIYRDASVENRIELVTVRISQIQCNQLFNLLPSINLMSIKSRL